MTRNELDQILVKHTQWLRGDPRGARADLRGADLRGADLTLADLTGAFLTGAFLRGAVLTGAVLTGAVLRRAVLRRADLRRAVLRRADLRGADLRGADLTLADLRGAVLRLADLRGADLRGADLRDADLGGAGIPAIDRIDKAILEAVEAEGNALDMSDWHLCDTTHCRAGWAIHLAGEAGYALEERVGSAAAGALIYAASGSHPTPNFFADNQSALDDIRNRAANQDRSLEESSKPVCGCGAPGVVDALVGGAWCEDCAEAIESGGAS